MNQFQWELKNYRQRKLQYHVQTEEFVESTRPLYLMIQGKKQHDNKSKMQKVWRCQNNRVKKTFYYMYILSTQNYDSRGTNIMTKKYCKPHKCSEFYPWGGKFCHVCGKPFSKYAIQKANNLTGKEHLLL